MLINHCFLVVCFSLFNNCFICLLSLCKLYFFFFFLYIIHKFIYIIICMNLNTCNFIKRIEQVLAELDISAIEDNCSHHLASLRQKAGQSRKTLPDGFTSLLVKTRTVPPRGTSWILGALRLQAKLCGISEQVGAPEVCMTHRPVATLWHLPIQSPAALQVDAYRQRLGEIKPHSPSYGSNSLTAL